MNLPALCLSLALGLVTGLPVAGSLLAAPDSGQVAVLFPPGWTRARVLLAAAESDARLVRFGGQANLAILDLPAGGPAAVREAGALLLLDPIVLGGCNRRPTAEGISS